MYFTVMQTRGAVVLAPPCRLETDKYWAKRERDSHVLTITGSLRGDRRQSETSISPDGQHRYIN